jgi:hypothetical protein
MFNFALPAARAGDRCMAIAEAQCYSSELSEVFQAAEQAMLKVKKMRAGVPVPDPDWLERGKLESKGQTAKLGVPAPDSDWEPRDLECFWEQLLAKSFEAAEW